MTTSGTYDFNPSLGEITIYAYMNIGLRPTSLVQEHMESARMATNMMLSRWANQGVNLWAVDLIETPLVQGQATYTVDLRQVQHRKLQAIWVVVCSKVWFHRFLSGVQKAATISV